MLLAMILLVPCLIVLAGLGYFLAWVALNPPKGK